MPGKREFGDYQTPLEFTDEVCRFLAEERGIAPSIVIEPTCGTGNFLKSSLAFNAEKYYGIEINPEYCETCKKEISSDKVEIINADFFEYDVKALMKNKALVIGNPPWVTNSTLSTLNSDNLPKKENFKGLKGIDALTGSSNFDICEYIILKLLDACIGSDATIAMLCKTSVARKVFEELKRRQNRFSYCDVIEFDAFKVFGINATACLLLLQLTKEESYPEFCTVYSMDDGSKAISRFGYVNGQFYSDLMTTSESFDGSSCFIWRQGVKHDCSKVMELTKKNNGLVNGKGEVVDIEPDLVFPLIKSSMFKKPIIDTFKKYVIVIQKKAREDTAHLQKDYPLTWAYLKANEQLFNDRKSSIYKGAPAFSMFGVGDYSYAQYKVGVSGFYKEPLFSVLYSHDGKPVMTDDTSYFICLPSFDAAYTAMLMLNSERVQTFLKSIAFLDAKRPYTKKVLQRIDFNKIYSSVTLQELKETEQKLELPSRITAKMIDEFAYVPEMRQQKMF